MEWSPRLFQCSDVCVQRLHCLTIGWNIRQRPLLRVLQAILINARWGLRGVYSWFEELDSPLRYLPGRSLQLVIMSVIRLWPKIIIIYALPPRCHCSLIGRDIGIQLVDPLQVTALGYPVERASELRPTEWWGFVC